MSGGAGGFDETVVGLGRFILYAFPFGLAHYPVMMGGREADTQRCCSKLGLGMGCYVALLGMNSSHVNSLSVYD